MGLLARTRARYPNAEGLRDLPAQLQQRVREAWRAGNAEDCEALFGLAIDDADEGFAALACEMLRAPHTGIYERIAALGFLRDGRAAIERHDAESFVRVALDAAEPQRLMLLPEVVGAVAAKTPATIPWLLRTLSESTNLPQDEVNSLTRAALEQAALRGWLITECTAIDPGGREHEEPGAARP
jgi:hypothetical protein